MTGESDDVTPHDLVGCQGAGRLEHADGTRGGDDAPGRAEQRPEQPLELGRTERLGRRGGHLRLPASQRPLLGHLAACGADRRRKAPRALLDELGGGAVVNAGDVHEVGVGGERRQKLPRGPWQRREANREHRRHMHALLAHAGGKLKKRLAGLDHAAIGQQLSVGPGELDRAGLARREPLRALGKPRQPPGGELAEHLRGAVAGIKRCVL